MTFLKSGRRLAAPLLALPGLFLLLASPVEAARGAGPYPPSAPPKAPLTGKVLFARNCVRCHGADGRAGLNGAHDLTKSNLNAFGRTYLVTKGLGKMPAFEEYLSPKEIEDVVAYSLTLK